MVYEVTIAHQTLTYAIYVCHTNF